MTEINWGYNCLTAGIHHGRPEAIWNLQLSQAVIMFDADSLRELVLTRIHKDAVQFVENSHPDHPITTAEWAEKTKTRAAELYLNVLSRKIGEISHYYASATYQRDIQDVVKWYKEDKLNSNYNPRHGHDSINMLCRILGQSASLSAAS